MENNERKNVLMTTMSILKRGTGVSYYYFSDAENATSLYCDGISSLEPGTKYFLSKYPIDEIIVVGSKETINKDDQRNIANLVETWNGLSQTRQEGKTLEVPSAFEFYKHRIASFLCEGGKDDGVDEIAAEWAGKGIDKKRRGELKVLLESVCPEENAFLMNPEPWKEIKNRIKESIKKGFEDSSEYEKYKEKKQQLFSYQAEYCENERLVEDYQKFRKEIEEDEELSLLEREYYYVYLDKMVEESIHNNIVKNLEAELIELRKERDELQYQIRTIRDARQQSEFDYVKYLAYESLDKKYKLRVLRMAEDFPQKKIAICFVDEQKYGEDNVNGIVNALYGKDGKEKEMNLYIDMQGGSRTFSYVRNAILSILSNQFPEKVKIKEIVSTNYNPDRSGASEIVIENRRYQIVDLVSGMNAFIRYGKADMIQNYCSTIGKLLKTEGNTALDCLVEYMVEIDNSISLCDMAALADAIKKIRNLLKGREMCKDEMDKEEEGGGEEKDEENESFLDNIFRILTDGIKNDYGRLLEETEGDGVDYIGLISWCVRKGFVQQALTLIEDKMPEVYFEKKILEYQFKDDVNGDQANRYVAATSPKYEKRVENKLFYNMQAMGWKNRYDDPLSEMLKKIPPLKGRQNNRGGGRKASEDKGSKESWHKVHAKNVLIRGGYTESDWEIKKERIEDLIDKMPRTEKEDDFIKLYCEFRRMNKEYEEFGEKGERNLTDPGTVYSIAKAQINAGNQIPFYSIISCCGTWKYTVKSSSKKSSSNTLKNLSGDIVENESDSEFQITLNLHSKLEDHKKELEQLFLLHEALKQERNCCNHASEKGLRLSVGLVKQAIEIYMKKLQEILGYLEGSEISNHI